jgi:hypothetical protein
LDNGALQSGFSAASAFWRPRIGIGPVHRSQRASDHRAREPEKETSMLRKFAIALLAASVLTAPVLAQGPTNTATPPAKTGTAAPAATPAAAPKVVAAKPTLKTAKVKTSKRFARHHVRHVKHFVHVKNVKHLKSAKTVHGAKHVRHVVRNSTTGSNGAMAAPKAKSSVN